MKLYCNFNPHSYYLRFINVSHARGISRGKTLGIIYREMRATIHLLREMRRADDQVSQRAATRRFREIKRPELLVDRAKRERAFREICVSSRSARAHLCIRY